MHRVLVEVTDRVLDFDHRVWHRVRVVVGFDEVVVEELECLVSRVRARGGVVVEVVFFVEVVELILDLRWRAERWFAVVEAKQWVGAFDLVLVLLVVAENGPFEVFERICIDLLWV